VAVAVDAAAGKGGAQRGSDLQALE
jgi:hypothetical protein